MDTIVIKKTKKVVKLSQEEQGQIIVHCHFHGNEDSIIRIWKSTFLICLQSGKKSKLLHAENITVYPIWTTVKGNKRHTFTLFFNSLPKSCRNFQLLEDIPESGGFFVPQIVRNKQDVYEVMV